MKRILLWMGIILFLITCTAQGRGEQTASPPDALNKETSTKGKNALSDGKISSGPAPEDNSSSEAAQIKRHLEETKRENTKLNKALRENKEQINELKRNHEMDQKEIEKVKKLEEINLRLQQDLKNANDHIKSLENGRQLSKRPEDSTEPPLRSFYEFQTIEAYGKTFDSFAVHPRKLQFFLLNRNGRLYGRINQLSRVLRGRLLFAANAGIFKKNGMPKGLYIEEGELIVEWDTRELGGRAGNFYLQPNGMFFVNKTNRASIMTTNEFRQKFKGRWRHLRLATQSGPMLLIHGKINDKFGPKSENRKIRIGVGILKQDKVLFLISNNPTNFYDFATLFKEFGCMDALFLDGGEVAEMYVREYRDLQFGPDLGPMIAVVD